MVVLGESGNGNIYGMFNLTRRGNDGKDFPGEKKSPIYKLGTEHTTRTYYLIRYKGPI